MRNEVRTTTAACLAIGNLPGVTMDARMRSAVQCMQELQGAPTMEACHAAAVLAGVSLVDADDCDDGACCCPRCPWRLTAANWRARPGSAGAVDLQGVT